MLKTKFVELPEKIATMIIPELGNTLYMLLLTVIFSLVIGTIIAVILILTEKQALKKNRGVNFFFDTLINFIMAFPFIILTVYIIPFTRLIVGTSIGATAAVVPLTIVESAFVAKIYRDDLREVNPYVIEAAKSYGATNLQIIMLMIKECIPSFVSGLTMLMINALGCTAMAGAVGAGGIGSVAILYGYRRSDTLITVTIAIILLLFVECIQLAGDKLYRRLK